MFFRAFRVLSVVMGMSLVFLSSMQEGKAALQAGLIKGSGPVIFYLASNGRRYAFPNEQTFRTWYQDFSQVRTVSDEELARYTYGGNVTYRPGTRLLQRTGDSKIYTVGRGGMLRWVTSPQVLQRFYGSNWRRLVDGLPDARVADYVFGDPVRTIRDASPSTERAQTPTIEQNRRVPALAVGSTSVLPSNSAPGSSPTVSSQGPTTPRPVTSPTVSAPSVTVRSPVAPVVWPGQVRATPVSTSAPSVSLPSGGSGAVNALSTADLSAYPGAQRLVSVGNESSLRTAVQSARPGDVIAMTGTFSLSRQLVVEARGTVDHPVYLVAARGRGTAGFSVVSEKALTITSGARYIVVDGLVINRAGGTVVEVQGQSSYITLRNLTLSDAGTDGDVVSIHQASYVTLEGSDLARPGRRADTSEGDWQEVIDVWDASQVSIRRNWIRDFGNMAGVIRGGSEYVRVEQNVMDGQRSGSGADPVWSIGGWTDSSLLTREIAYEAIGTTFEHNVIAHGAYGAMAVVDATDTSVAHNLFLNNSGVLFQLRAGNAVEQATDGLRITNNRFVDTRGSMPNVCEVQSHDIRALTAANNIYSNNGVALPSESDCGFTPATEAGVTLDSAGMVDVTPSSYEAAMLLVART